MVRQYPGAKEWEVLRAENQGLQESAAGFWGRYMMMPPIYVCWFINYKHYKPSTYMCIYIYLYIYIYTPTYIYIYTRTYIYIYIYVHMYICIYIYIYIYMHMFIYDM